MNAYKTIGLFVGVLLSACAGGPDGSPMQSESPARTDTANAALIAAAATNDPDLMAAALAASATCHVADTHCGSLSCGGYSAPVACGAPFCGSTQCGSSCPPFKPTCNRTKQAQLMESYRVCHDSANTPCVDYRHTTANLATCCLNEL